MNTHTDGTESREHLRGAARPEPGSRFEREVSPATAEVTSELRDSVCEVLRRAFRSAPGAGSTGGADEDTEDAVRTVCAMARANDVRAESLILALKAAWRQFPQAHGATRMDAEVMLAELITTCIREYYTPQRRR